METTVVLFIAALGSATIARADCRVGTFPSQPPAVGLAVVTGAGPAAFVKDDAGCPAPADRCRSRAYVVAGDRVITGARSGDYVCAYFPNAGGGSAGYLPAARLSARAVDPAPRCAPGSAAGKMAMTRSI